MRTTLVLGLAVWATAPSCGRKLGGADAGAVAVSSDPAVGNSAPTPSITPKPAPPSTATFEEAAAPTAEESAQTPMPRFVPIVPNPSPKSKLPCPEGTRLSPLDTSVSCRALRPKNAFHTSEGPALAFHANGKLRSQGQYTDGQSTGHWWFFTDSGALDYEVDYVEGEYDGIYVSYWPSGARRLEDHQRHGVLEGVSKSWDEKGKLVSWSLYQGGKLVRRKAFR